MPKRDVLDSHFLRFGPGKYLDYHFRLVRHENVEPIIDACHHGLQKAVKATTSYGNVIKTHQLETDNGVRYSMFQGVAIQKLFFHEKHGMLVELKFDCPPTLRGSKFNQSKVFEPGMLCSFLAVHEDGSLNVIHCNIHSAGAEVSQSLISLLHQC